MSSRSSPFSDRRWAPLALAASLLVGAEASADTIDPAIPRSLAVGAPRGAAPSERLDASRSGRAKTRLPRAPIELWPRHINGGLKMLPVVDAEGNIIVSLTTPPEVIKLSPEGKEVWRVRIGAHAPAVPPVLGSDGTLMVITAAGRAWGIAPSGAVRFNTSLGVRGSDLDVAPLALTDGGVLVAAGGALVEIDRDGAVRARTRLEVRPGSVDSRITGALLAAPSGDPRLAGAVLFTTETGSVYSYRAPGAPRKIGSFGGYPRTGAILADARTLIAVVDNRRVVAFDLPTSTTHVRAAAPPLSLFDGLVTMGAGPHSGLAFVALQSGLIAGVDAAGNEKARVALDKPPPLPDPSAVPIAGAGAGGVAGGGSSSVISFFGPTDLKPSPPLIIDPDGRIGFVRANGRVGVVSPEGAVTLGSERVCGSPIGILPAGDRRMLVACTDGGLWLYGE